MCLASSPFPVVWEDRRDERGNCKIISYDFARWLCFSRLFLVLAPSVCGKFRRYHETNPLLYVPCCRDVIKNSKGTFEIHAQLASYLFVAVSRLDHYAEVRSSFS